MKRILVGYGSYLSWDVRCYNNYFISNGGGWGRGSKFGGKEIRLGSG